jgi:hypothetical protein
MVIPGFLFQVIDTLGNDSIAIPKDARRRINLQTMICVANRIGRCLQPIIATEII